MPERRTLNRTYSVGDQVPTCPVFTRAKTKVPFWDLSRFPVTVLLSSSWSNNLRLRYIAILKTLSSDNDNVISPSDKGNVVVMNSTVVEQITAKFQENLSFLETSIKIGTNTRWGCSFDKTRLPSKNLRWRPSWKMAAIEYTEINKITKTCPIWIILVLNHIFSSCRIQIWNYIPSH